MSIEVTVSGDKETMAALAELRNSVQKRLVEGAGRAALKPVVADVRARCPVNTGALKKSIGTKKASKAYVQDGEIVLSVGARHGFEYTDADGKKHDPFWYATPLEYGHDLKMPGSDKVVAHLAPLGMFRAAFERNRNQIVEDFASELRDRVEEHLDA